MYASGFLYKAYPPADPAIMHKHNATRPAIANPHRFPEGFFGDDSPLPFSGAEPVFLRGPGSASIRVADVSFK
jgi:hypothetical protein